MTTDLKLGLDKLGLALLKEAEREETKPDTRIDIFKAVAAYYLGTQRATKGKASEDESTATFGAILNRLKP
jgi:hypothetical protein